MEIKRTKDTLLIKVHLLDKPVLSASGKTLHLIQPGFQETDLMVGGKPVRVSVCAVIRA